mmetsp:Transcript_76483/g.216229  ORF Transcript_76483/g.216229 Transcript_76483/m.216229 type:complete len:521 (-) Transcript_76483:1777-3339(-)
MPPAAVPACLRPGGRGVRAEEGPGGPDPADLQDAAPVHPHHHLRGAAVPADADGLRGAHRAHGAAEAGDLLHGAVPRALRRARGVLLLRQDRDPHVGPDGRRRRGEPLRRQAGPQAAGGRRQGAGPREGGLHDGGDGPGRVPLPHRGRREGHRGPDRGRRAPGRRLELRPRHRHGVARGLAQQGAVRRPAEGDPGLAPGRRGGGQEGEGGAHEKNRGGREDTEAGEDRGEEAPGADRAAAPLLLGAAAHEHHLPGLVIQHGQGQLGNILPHEGVARGHREAACLEAGVVRRDLPQDGGEGPAGARARVQAHERRPAGRQGHRQEAAGGERARHDLRRFHLVQVRDPQGLHARDQGAQRLGPRLRDAHGRRAPDGAQRRAGGDHRLPQPLRGPHLVGGGARGLRVGTRNHHPGQHLEVRLRPGGDGEAEPVPRPDRHGEVPGAGPPGPAGGRREGPAARGPHLRPAVPVAEGAGHPGGEDQPEGRHAHVRRRRQRRRGPEAGRRRDCAAQRVRQRQRGRRR